MEYKMRNKIICGAKTRKDTPCQAKALLNGRCRNHGGLSTGPRTLEGKARSLAALRDGNRAWRILAAKDEAKTMSVRPN